MSERPLELAPEDLARLSRLAPFLALLALTFAAIAGLGAYDAFGELAYYGRRQPARVPYLLVIYGGFELLALLSAGRATQAAQRLHRLRTTPDAATLRGALAALHDTLRLFSAWLLCSALGFAWLQYRAGA